MDGVSFAQGLLGGAILDRKLFWHFPHYTNQGGRPSGAVRDGNWLLVELYDEKKAELYDLSADIGEKQNLANRHPACVAAMRAALDAWRKANDVQYNTPNPNCVEDAFKALYLDMDPSSFDPVTADVTAWARIRQWRTGMDTAIRKKQE